MLEKTGRVSWLLRKLVAVWTARLVKRQILASGLFDESFYKAAYPGEDWSRRDPLDHYLRIGYREGRQPSEQFDSRGYLHRNGDVHAAGFDPLTHWVRHGSKEGRLPPVRPQGRSMTDDEHFLLTVFCPNLRILDRTAGSA